MPINETKRKETARNDDKSNPAGKPADCRLAKKAENLKFKCAQKLDYASSAMRLHNGCMIIGYMAVLFHSSRRKIALLYSACARSSFFFTQARSTASICAQNLSYAFRDFF